MVMVESALGTGIRWTIGRKRPWPDRPVAFTYTGLPMVVEFVLVLGRVNPMPGRAAINQDQALALWTNLPVVKTRKSLVIFQDHSERNEECFRIVSY
jgi:hypothetical protein